MTDASSVSRASSPDLAMSIVERVARAIQGVTPLGYGLNDREAQEFARAAITAMMAPTEAMMRAAIPHMAVASRFLATPGRSGRSVEVIMPNDPNFVGPENAYRAMLTAALADESPPAEGSAP